MPSHQRSSQLLSYLLFIIFALLVSGPILLAGYYSDDARNSLTLGEVQNSHLSVFTYATNIALNWLYGGRVYPFAIYSSYIFNYLFPNIIIYQVMRLLFIWLSVFSVAWLVQQLTQHKIASMLMLFLVPMCWSIHNYHESLTSFSILLPLVLMLSCFAIIFFSKAINSQKFYWHLLACTAFILALNTYEIAYAIPFAILLIAWQKFSLTRKLIYNTLPYVVISLLYFALVIYLRANVPGNSYDGVQVASISGIPHTFINQALGALPLNYWLFAPKRYFPLPYFNDHFGIALFVPSVLLFLCAIWPLYYLLSTLTLTRQNIRTLICIAMPFIAIPSLLVSVSQKYQDTIHVGVPYLPVYMEYAGVALLLLCLCQTINLIHDKYWRRITTVCVAIIFSMILSTALFMNYYTVLLMNNEWKNPRELVQSALEAGLFDRLPANAMLYKKHDAWNRSAFYRQNRALTIQTSELNNVELLKQASQSIAKNVYLIDYQTVPDSQSGYVLLARIVSLRYQIVSKDVRAVQMTIENPTIFFRLKPRQFFFIPGKSVSQAAIMALLNQRLQPNFMLPHGLSLTKNIPIIQIIYGRFTFSYDMWVFDGD